MKERLLPLIEQLKSDRKLTSFDEAATKQAIILRILSLLGWDNFNIDEVAPEYSVAGKKVDYSLRHSNINKVFIEVKKMGEDLEQHQEQLLNYSFQEGVKLSVLTNGITWWFYLPLHEGSWEQRKFYTIEIYAQNAEEITGRFIDYLAKENILSGKAIENAEAIYKSRQKKYLIKDTLPKAWNKLISEPDELLIDLIAESTEKLCGHKPDHLTVADFISSNISEIEISPRPQIKGPAPSKRKIRAPKIENYTGKSISAFYFRGSKYEVRSWKDLLITLCGILNATHITGFDKVLTIAGRRRPYFTRKANELRVPGKVKNTNIFVETNLNSNGIVKICFDMLAVFGYSSNDLRIEAY